MAIINSEIVLFAKPYERNSKNGTYSSMEAYVDADELLQALTAQASNIKGTRMLKFKLKPYAKQDENRFAIEVSCFKGDPKYAKKAA